MQSPAINYNNNKLISWLYPYLIFTPTKMLSMCCYQLQKVALISCPNLMNLIFAFSDTALKLFCFKSLSSAVLFIIMTWLISTANKSAISVCRCIIIECVLLLQSANSAGMKLPQRYNFTHVVFGESQSKSIIDRRLYLNQKCLLKTHKNSKHPVVTTNSK